MYGRIIIGLSVVIVSVACLLALFGKIELEAQQTANTLAIIAILWVINEAVKKGKDE